MQDEVKARLYQQRKNALFLLNLGSTLLFLFIMAYSFSLPLRTMINRLSGNSVIVITLYFFFFYLFYFVFTFGLKYYEGFVLERKFGLSRQNFKSWFRQLIKKETPIFCVLLVVVQVVYFFLETSVQQWWLSMAIICILINGLGGDTFRRYIAMLFFRYTPVQDPDLCQRLIDLARKADVKIANVYVIHQPHNKADVALAGMGSMYKLMLTDEVITYSKEEIEVIFAQEIASCRYKQLWKLLAIQIVGWLGGFYAINILFEPASKIFGFNLLFDVATLPVILGLFFVFFVLFSIIQNCFRKYMEKKTDWFALQLTKAPDAFVSLLIRLREQRFKTPDPHYFIELLLNRQSYFSERLNMAQDYAQSLSFNGLKRDFKFR